jgi:hypothetical protein
MPAKAVLHDLTLLLHPIRFEWLARLAAVPVRTRADSHLPVQEVTHLSGNPMREIASRSPGLILAAMSELMRQNGQVFLTSVGKEDVIAQSHRPVPAGPEHQAAQEYRRAAGPSILAHPPAVHYLG